MSKRNRFREELSEVPFESYEEYMDYIFACVNVRLTDYIENLMGKYATGQGQYKNIMYPDIEIAYNLCNDNVLLFSGKDLLDEDEVNEGTPLEETFSGLDDELQDLLGAFSEEMQDADEEEAEDEEEMESVEEMLSFIDHRIAVSDAENYAFYKLCKKLKTDHFTTFALAAALLSSTQTSYASVYQIVNENGSLTAPTVESAARLYFGKDFSITKASSAMSACLEALLPVMDLRVNSNMPFSTVLTPDKRIIDFLFGVNPLRLDENYQRFFRMLTDEKELDPIMANDTQLEAMKVSYEQGVRIFSWFGDEGSGRRFFIKHFCKQKSIRAITMNCKKLFAYDFSFVEKALWAVRRECIFTDSCCCLNELDYREDEKEKYLGYMDLAISKLQEHDILIFTMSRDKLPLKSVTDQDFTELELPTPGNQERENCWRYFSQDYSLDKDVELPEMATKFLFTPGKIKSALKQAKSFSLMNHEILISRAKLFEGCYNQMSSELTQKATKVKANFGFEDIVMNASQRETLEHAIDQMNFRKKVYDNWNYIKKYPYGRGLSVLLFGAPGTGKSMCAQVIAHELNLELYRVDLSKVIDKYVGETEKSISMIFREAKKCNVVLFFDECDTLFAKRSDDGGSNQASNNNKTALLLQEVEAYDGVSVLATNYKHNIDPAFFRRMKYIVEFQFPDPDTREMLWRTTIPKGTPLADDVDIRFLAERFEFVGGNIKNCILNAAFLAAADGEGKEVGMKHYLMAIKYEFVKTGKVFTKADFEPYAYMVGLGEQEED
ncbi:MAG: ATP-binding protein [Lachnospiraceae bacterium]|nr:ATP-binding protein [Lachnospiraceae bacterium]